VSSALELLHRLYHFDELIRWGGHLILIAIVFAETGLMAGFFLPGDSLLVTAGLFAASGQLNLAVLLVELCLAAILGDSLNYSVGRRLGPRIFSREDSLLFHKDHLHRTKRFYEKYGSKTIVLARFVPVVRTFAPVVAGVGEMDYKTFLTYNVVGGVGWVCAMIFTGYFLGRVIPHVDRHVHKIILVVIFLSILPALIELWKERKSRTVPVS
jgi:membrane-associated protein